MDGMKCVVVPERDCIGKAAALKLESRIENLERWQQDSKKFHNTFYDWQREQIAREAKLDEKLNNMDLNIEKLLQKQEAADEKPKKFIDKISTELIIFIITAIFAFALGKIGF